MPSPFRARTPWLAGETSTSGAVLTAYLLLSAAGQGGGPTSDELYVHPPSVTSRTDRRSRCSLWTRRASKLFGGFTPRASARAVALATVASRASFRAALSWTIDASATDFAAATCGAGVVVELGSVILGWCAPRTPTPSQKRTLSTDEQTFEVELQFVLVMHLIPRKHSTMTPAVVRPSLKGAIIRTATFTSTPSRLRLRLLSLLWFSRCHFLRAHFFSHIRCLPSSLRPGLAPQAKQFPSHSRRLRGIHSTSSRHRHPDH